MAISQMHEVVGNIHIHTPYSDGSSYHEQIARQAIEAGLDFVIITDHNVLVHDVEGIYSHQGRQVLVIVGEELHDSRREPPGNHLLAFGINEEFGNRTNDPQELINAVAEAGGLTFLAHPYDQGFPQHNLHSFAWHDWDVSNYTGIELWNYMSECKSLLKSTIQGIRAVLSPHQFIKGPAEQTLKKWDELLALDRQVVGIGGSDAHGLQKRLGPLRRVIFPYIDLFRSVNNHVLLNTPLSGDFEDDKRRILEAIAAGRVWIGNDYFASTSNFRFSAQGHNFSTVMGGQIRLNYGVTLQVGVPQLSTIRLIHNGRLHSEESDISNRSFIVNEPGVYRVEVYLPARKQSRGWIFSNPIYVF